MVKIIEVPSNKKEHVMTDTFKMSVGEAHELDLAARRNNLTHEDIKYLSGGKRLARALAFLRGETLALNKSRIVLNDDLIARPFTCDLALTGMAAIDATGRKKYVNDKVVAAMPCATAASGTLYFFRVKKTLKVRQPALEAAKRGLRLVDPHTLAAFNTANSEFADTHPNGTEWDDADGNACFASFRRWDGERVVSVAQDDNDWDDDWWFAAVSNEDSELNS